MSNPRIRAILDTLLGEWGAEPAFEKDQLDRAEAKLEDYFLELVGEDEPLQKRYSGDFDTDLNAHQHNLGVNIRNRVKAELRNKIKGGEDEQA